MACTPSQPASSAAQSPSGVEPATTDEPAQPAPVETPTSTTPTLPGDGPADVEETKAEPTPPKQPKQGEPCPEGVCADGLTCVEYYGIAGAKGPKFTSCEVRCTRDASKCPPGQACVTIADGPGEVCRPK